MKLLNEVWQLVSEKVDMTLAEVMVRDKIKVRSRLQICMAVRLSSFKRDVESNGDQ